MANNFIQAQKFTIEGTDDTPIYNYIAHNEHCSRLGTIVGLVWSETMEDGLESFKKIFEFTCLSILTIRYNDKSVTLLHLYIIFFQLGFGTISCGFNISSFVI